ncbi:uncharacterized protein [Cherax quadricarinatus]
MEEIRSINHPQMAGLVPLDNERDKWCREKLEFVCAVVSGVDRESLKAQLDICETDEDAEGLMQSLLWLQDHNEAQLLSYQTNQEQHHNHLQQNLNDHEDLRLQYRNDPGDYPQGQDYPGQHPQNQGDPGQHLQNQDDPEHHPQVLDNLGNYPHAHDEAREYPQVQENPEGQLLAQDDLEEIPHVQDDPGEQFQNDDDSEEDPEEFDDPEEDPEEFDDPEEDHEEFLQAENASGVPEQYNQPVYPVLKNIFGPFVQVQDKAEQGQNFGIVFQEAEVMDSSGAASIAGINNASEIAGASGVNIAIDPAGGLNIKMATAIAGASGEDTVNDELMAQLLAEEETLVKNIDTVGDEQLARELSEETEEHEEMEEDRVAAHLAALVNMFPDAEPGYLEERCIEISGAEENFEQLVEDLLQKKSTEPRMSGYLKQQRQTIVAQIPSTSTAMEIPETLLDPEQDAAANELHECTICYEESVLEKNMATCNAYYNFHKFCIDCIRKHVAAQIGQGNTRFKCMNGYCESEFSWRTLKRVMEPVVFEKLQERKQQDEIRAAGIENLESCPFCNFMIIMPDQENKVLECLNPECLKESCRLCKEASHIPYRCNEIEKTDQKDARTEIENRMAEAMIRECPNCKKRFIIEAGCNRMTCPCGAVMCYLCKSLISNDYNHFEREQVASNKCPLWSNATDLHTSEVREAAVRAKQEMDPNISLLHDPTSDIM